MKLHQSEGTKGSVWQPGYEEMIPRRAGTKGRWEAPRKSRLRAGGSKTGRGSWQYLKKKEKEVRGLVRFIIVALTKGDNRRKRIQTTQKKRTIS